MDRKGEIHNNTNSCWYDEWCFPWNLNVLGIMLGDSDLLKPSVLAGCFWGHTKRGLDHLFIAKCGWNYRLFISYCCCGCAVGPQFFVWCLAEVEWLLSERVFWFWGFFCLLVFWFYFLLVCVCVCVWVCFYFFVGVFFELFFWLGFPFLVL